MRPTATGLVAVAAASACFGVAFVGGALTRQDDGNSTGSGAADVLGVSQPPRLRPAGQVPALREPVVRTAPAPAPAPIAVTPATVVAARPVATAPQRRVTRALPPPVTPAPKAVANPAPPSRPAPQAVAPAPKPVAAPKPAPKPVTPAPAPRPAPRPPITFFDDGT